MSSEFERKRLKKLLNKASYSRGRSKKRHAQSRKKKLIKDPRTSTGGWDT